MILIVAVELVHQRTVHEPTVVGIVLATVGTGITVAVLLIHRTTRSVTTVDVGGVFVKRTLTLINGRRRVKVCVYGVLTLRMTLRLKIMYYEVFETLIT